MCTCICRLSTILFKIKKPYGFRYMLNDSQTIKELLSHKTLTMTLRYAHLIFSHKVKAADILDSTINDSPTIQKLYKMKEAANE